MQQSFCGQYFKCQNDTQTLAVISARHGPCRSVQLITDHGAWNVTQGMETSVFGRDGIQLDLHADGLSAVGALSFDSLTPLHYDIMGPFRYVPFLECRHQVISMHHYVDGALCINGEQYRFQHDPGYIEGDRGRSFPTEYLWTQCFFDGGSLMLSVAEIPFFGRRFTGVLCVILMDGKEYRLATYCGAKAVTIAHRSVTVRQAGFTFSAQMLRHDAHPLFAPINGNMVRTIHESAACSARYRLEEKGQVLLDFQSDHASFEFEYDR